MAGAVFSKLEKGLWRRRDNKLQTKLRVYNALVVPVALYGAESWTFSREIKNKMDVFEGRWLRRIIGVKWPNVMSNEELRQRTGQVKLSEEGISRAIRWAGHMWRMDESIALQELQGQ